MTTTRKIPPTHPGEILRTEFLEPLGMSQDELARRLGVDIEKIRQIVNEEFGITADTALRLGTLFNTSADLWLGLQIQYELDVAEDKLDEIIKEVHPLENA